MATHSFDTILSYGAAGGGGGYTELVGVRNISAPKAKVTMSKATKLRSTSARAEVVAGFVDEGGFSCELLFDKTVQNAMRGFLRAKKSWKITFPDGANGNVDGSTLLGDGFISEIGVEVPEDDVISVPVSFQATGPWTFTPAS